jgi:hypothetical protein
MIRRRTRQFRTFVRYDLEFVLKKKLQLSRSKTPNCEPLMEGTWKDYHKLLPRLTSQTIIDKPSLRASKNKVSIDTNNAKPDRVTPLMYSMLGFNPKMVHIEQTSTILEPHQRVDVELPEHLYNLRSNSFNELRQVSIEALAIHQGLTEKRENARRSNHHREKFNNGDLALVRDMELDKQYGRKFDLK